jgi:phosphoglycolate phosphatase
MNSKFPYQAVIFDLDGTLIDSAPSILASFESALKRAGAQSLVPFTNSLIGPPLRQTLINLTGITNDAELDTLVGYFKDSYDAEGYKLTRVYEGVEYILASLSEKMIPMAIATNKRKVPTNKILDLLGWSSYFEIIGTLDSITPPYPEKATLIGALLDEMSLDASMSLYVGDKREDGVAADMNSMSFIAAGWGYEDWGEIKIQSGWQVDLSPADFVKRFADQCHEI